MITNNRDENVKIAKELVGLAKELIAYNKDSIAMSMTREEILNFLYSQIKQIEITVKLPNIEEVVNNTEHTAAQKYPQTYKKKRNEEFIRQYEEEREKEQKELNEIKIKWEQLATMVDSLPTGNYGKPFYDKEFVVRVLSNRSIQVKFTSRNNNKDISTTNLNPHDEVNKNNPFIYEGIDSTNDYRDFIVKKFDNNQMEFKECIIKPYDFDMPLDVYKTQAKPQICEHEIDVYVKFGIHKNKAKVVVEFENFSFHPLQQQSSQRTENTGTSN